MKRLVLKYGAILGLCLIGFFLIMHLLGLSNRYDLRIYNLLFHISLLYVVIMRFRKQSNNLPCNYIKCVSLGILTSFIAIVMFSIFMGVFLSTNPDFMAGLTLKFDIGEYLNPITASFFLFCEGMAVSVFVSYIMTRIADISIVSRARRIKQGSGI